jgi:hypothetical protein
MTQIVNVIKNKEMNSKFYVSYKAARLLKEKGYNEETIYYYNSAGKLYLGNEHFNYNAYAVNLSAPSKAEAIDWLESKGILIATSFTYSIKWFCTIESLVRDEMVATLISPTRLEAEEAAIIKALELL